MLKRNNCYLLIMLSSFCFLFGCGNQNVDERDSADEKEVETEVEKDDKEDNKENTKEDAAEDNIDDESGKEIEADDSKKEEGVSQDSNSSYLIDLHFVYDDGTDMYCEYTYDTVKSSYEICIDIFTDNTHIANVMCAEAISDQITYGFDMEDIEYVQIIWCEDGYFSFYSSGNGTTDDNKMVIDDKVVNDIPNWNDDSYDECADMISLIQADKEAFYNEVRDTF